jgi:hypothetical protein
MAQSSPEINEIARHRVAEFIPDAEHLSRRRLSAKVREMVLRSPDTARRMMDDTCQAVDEATGGRYRGQVDALENLVNEALGLRPGTIPRSPAS